MNMNTVRNTLLVFLLAVPGLAPAAPEVESNNTAAGAQALEIGPIVVDGRSTSGAIIEGVIGNLAGAAVNDVDFFTFDGSKGDVVTLDIDGGIGGARNVDTIIAIFGPAPEYKLLRTVTDATSLDPGSTSKSDARIDNFNVLADGTYTVGVGSFSRHFVTGGTIACARTSCLTPTSNGDYTLIVAGVTPPVQQISIEIKPGSDDIAPINPKARGKVPVALLGSDAFEVEDVDTGTLTFGRSGTEPSLSKCGAPGDVNGDAFPDMVCHFENQAAQFVATDEEAILRGKLDGGRKFEGRGWLKVVPVKAED